MPIVPFSSYTLNNDNAECWYVLVFDCTLGNFVFMNPCNLLTGCHLDLNDYIDWDTFDRCQIVNSPLVTGMLPGNILRVNSTGTCIEWVTLASLINPSMFDYMVKVQATDNPQYLISKIVWTPGRVSVTLIPGVNQSLQIDVIEAGINWLLPANPSCIDPTYNPTWYAALVYDSVSWVHWECNQNRADSYWYQRYVSADYTINSGDPWFPAWWSIAWASYWFVNTAGGEWLPDMEYMLDWTLWALNFPAGTQIPAIEIQESWLYAVWANVSFTVTGDGIEAVRFFVFTNNSKTMVLNMKFSDNGLPVVPAWATSIDRTLSGYNYVYLKKWEYLFMWLRLYTPSADPFSITIQSDALPLANPFPASPSWNLCGSTFGCALISKSIQNSS